MFLQEVVYVGPSIVRSEKLMTEFMNNSCFVFGLWFRASLIYINLLAPELFFLILAHPVYKMLIIQETNTLELWNQLYFEEKKTESIYNV